MKAVLSLLVVSGSGRGISAFLRAQYSLLTDCLSVFDSRKRQFGSSCLLSAQLVVALSNGHFHCAKKLGLARKFAHSQSSRLGSQSQIEFLAASAAAAAAPAVTTDRLPDCQYECSPDEQLEKKSQKIVSGTHRLRGNFNSAVR